MRRVDILFFVHFIVISLMIVGAFLTPGDFAIDPEYLNGILTASSVLFGFWVFLLGTIARGRKRGKKYTKYELLIRNYLYVSLFVLVSSMLAIYFNALNFYPSRFALLICAASFMNNLLALLLLIHLYFSKFLQTKTADN